MEANIEKDSFEENCISEYIVSKEKLDNYGFLLNTFIYLYLTKNFKNVEFYLNNYKVQHDLTKEIFYKFKILNDVGIRKNKKQTDMNSIFQYETSGVNIEEENEKILFTNVKYIVFDIFLLESTKEKLEFPYNLVKLKIEIDIDNNLVKIKSLEHTLIKKNWNFSLYEVFNKKEYEQINDSQLTVYFQKSVKQEEQKKVKEVLINAINSHSLFCKINFDDTKKDVVEEPNHNNGSNNFIDEREKQIFKRELRENEKLIENCDIYKIKDEINNLLFFLYEPAFYNISLNKENDICYKKMYDQFKKIMIRSRTLKLNKEFIAYLLCESIFLPNYVKKNKFTNVEEDEYSSISSYSKSSSELEKCTGTEENVKKIENTENEKNRKNMEETEESYSSGEVTLYGVSEDNSSGSNVEEKPTNEKKKKKKKKKKTNERVI